MIFKHMNIYRITGKIDAEKLENFLDENPFEPCLPNQERTAGFTTIVGLDKRIFSTGGVHLICLMVQEKIIPAGAVKARLQAAIEAKQAKGIRLNRDEKKALKEEIRQAMIPNAFVKNNELWAYVDNVNKLLVINTSSRKAADGLAQSLRSCSEDESIYPARPQHDVSARMTFWLREDQAPEKFVIGSECIITDGEGKIRYTKRDLEDDRLRNYLENNLTVSEMALEFNERCGLSLVEDFMIKNFSLTDVAMNDLDQGNGEPLEMLAADLILMSSEVDLLLKGLFDALGGEQTVDEE